MISRSKDLCQPRRLVLRLSIVLLLKFHSRGAPLRILTATDLYKNNKAPRYEAEPLCLSMHAIASLVPHACSAKQIALYRFNSYIIINIAHL